MFKWCLYLCFLKEALALDPLNLALYIVFVLTPVAVIYAGLISVSLSSGPHTFNVIL